MEIVTGGIRFSDAQIAEISAYADDLEATVRNLQIAPEPVSRDEAEGLSGGNERLVFSVEMSADSPGGEVFRVGSRLVPGVDDDSDDYYVGAVEFDVAEDHEGLYTELAVFCPECEFGTQEDGSECEICDEGEFIFDLSWDDRWKVTARVDAYLN